MRTAVIITTDNYPGGDAGAVREHTFAKIMQDLDFSVTVLGYGQPTAGMRGVYDGVDYVTFRPNSKNKFIRMAYRAVSHKRMLKCLYSIKNAPEILLAVGVSPRTYHALEKYASKHDTILIHDSVEWYSPEEFINGVKSKAYRNNNKINMQIINHKWRVIAISEYLFQHFLARCQKVVRIPVIMDVQSLPCRTKKDKAEKIRFVYAGSPGRKDYLSELLAGFSLLSDDQLSKLEIHLFGATKQQLLDVCGVSQKILTRLQDCLFAHGRVPREQALRGVMEADYSMLLRDETLRYAKAGFPTKIVECLSCGTVPFCNLSSDLGMYLQDGQNAIIIDGHTAEAVKAAAEKALSVSTEKMSCMRCEARKTAEQFDYRRYMGDIADLLK